ncbi:MAG: EAL domain-containing protein [Burkholderiaceae bacterium]
MDNARPLRLAPWSRLHQSLMPDYNAKATAYWWGMAALGSLLLAYAASKLLAEPLSTVAMVVVGCIIAAIAGMFPVRVPRSTNSFAAGETFIFLLLLLYGPDAATIAAAAEAAAGSWRTSRRWTSRIASPTMAAVAMFVVGHAFAEVLRVVSRLETAQAPVLLAVSVMLALIYFVSNTVLITLVLQLKRDEPMNWRALFSNFGWVGIVHAASASLATLLYLTFQQSGAGVLMAAVPILTMLLTTLHFFFRHQAADEAVRKSRLEAAEREAEQAARHLAELRQSEQQLRESEQRFHSAFTHASIGMALVTFDGHVLQANRALGELLGRDDAELRGRRFDELLFERDMPTFRRYLQRVHSGAIDSFEDELRCLHRNGTIVWVAAGCSVFSEGAAEQPRLILQLHDITARRDAEERLHHIAFHDSLTGLPNRARFHKQLTRVIDRARGSQPVRYAVMFLDFDRFKLINDSLGHDAGDEFLVQVARRIRDNVRHADFVARLGGDEFAVLCDKVEQEDAIVDLADRLLAALQRPFDLSGTEITTSASIGITFSRFGYTTPEDVLRDADIAMYKAKAQGKGRVALFDAGLHAQVSARMRMENELRAAIGNGQLTVAYQPLYAMKSGSLVGFEALARWTHPERGTISPGAFIPVAEEAALMVPLTDLVLETACRDLRLWQQRDERFARLHVHVNVSGHDIAHGGLGARIARVLRETGLAPGFLNLELTENILMERLDGAMRTLERMRELGVGLSVDDFGTGYSSLSYLSSLPIDCLKIDRSFVHALKPGAKQLEVVRAIVWLGRALGKSVIAEGIETEEQFEQLRHLGCDIGQGYHLSQPLPKEGVDELLRRIEAEAEVDEGESPRASRFGRLASVLTFRI